MCRPSDSHTDENTPARYDYCHTHKDAQAADSLAIGDTRHTGGLSHRHAHVWPADKNTDTRPCRRTAETAVGAEQSPILEPDTDAVCHARRRDCDPFAKRNGAADDRANRHPHRRRPMGDHHGGGL